MIDGAVDGFGMPIGSFYYLGYNNEAFKQITAIPVETERANCSATPSACWRPTRSPVSCSSRKWITIASKKLKGVWKEVAIRERLLRLVLELAAAALVIFAQRSHHRRGSSRWNMRAGAGSWFAATLVDRNVAIVDPLLVHPFPAHALLSG